MVERVLQISIIESDIHAAYFNISSKMPTNFHGYWLFNMSYQIVLGMFLVVSDGVTTRT